MERYSPEKAESEASLIASLEKAKSTEEKQEILNQIFSKERRERMISGSSEDTKGRKVRYYRYVMFEKLLEILKTDKQSPHSYFDPKEGVDVKMLKEFLIDHWSYSKKSEHPETDLDALFEGEYSLREKDLEEVFIESFPQVGEQEIKKIAASLDNRELLAFIEKYTDKKFLKTKHSGGYLLRFSPYISMSVGGIIISSLVRGINYGHVYLEIVVPDDRIIPHLDTVQGEKEVLIKEISREDITRVFIDNKQLESEVLGDKRCAIGDYISKNEIKPHSFGPVEQWRWNEETEDCLPVGLIKNHK